VLTQLEEQVQSVTEGSAALQARYATLEIQAAKVKFNFQKVLVFMLSFKRPPPPPFLTWGPNAYPCLSSAGNPADYSKLSQAHPQQPCVPLNCQQQHSTPFVS